MVSLISMVLFGAFLVAGMLRSWTHKEDQVIVIEREPNQVAAIAGAPANTAAAAPASADDNDEDEAQPEPPAKGAGVVEDVPGAAPTRQKESATAAKPQPPANAAPVEPDPALLTKRFAQEQSRVQRCFATEAQQSDAQAELTLEFQVSSAGVVERAELLHPASAALGSCLLDVAKSTRFPRLTRAVTFRIPIQTRVAQP
jgi:outer membrane biosynthesis protein TonB